MTPLRIRRLPALRDNRVVLLHDPGVLLAGPSMATTVASMAVALHPDLAEQVGQVFRNAAGAVKARPAAERPPP